MPQALFSSGTGQKTAVRRGLVFIYYLQINLPATKNPSFRGGVNKTHQEILPLPAEIYKEIRAGVLTYDGLSINYSGAAVPDSHRLAVQLGFSLRSGTLGLLILLMKYTTTRRNIQTGEFPSSLAIVDLVATNRERNRGKHLQ